MSEQDLNDGTFLRIRHGGRELGTARVLQREAQGLRALRPEEDRADHEREGGRVMKRQRASRGLGHTLSLSA